jgi:hypothetical protein
MLKLRAWPLQFASHAASVVNLLAGVLHEAKPELQRGDCA